ncbi:MAG TPA: dihydrolipoamide acetyltransferase family protein [Candidatus Elarobacter sp.]
MTAPLLDVRLADVGEGIAEAEIVEWLVRPGDTVKADQAVVVITTDKAAVEIPAPVAGTVRELAATPGTIVPTGGLLLRLETAAAAAPNGRAPQAAPSTRKRAAELGVDLREVVGTGPDGRVLADDVERHAAPPSRAEPAVETRDVEIVPLRGLRRQTARAVAESWRTIPAIAEFRDVDATGLIAARDAARAVRSPGAPPFTLLPFFVRAVVRALARNPSFNASIDVERNEIARRTGFHVGIATATDDGLVVPVLRDADALDLDGLAAELDRLVRRARAGELQPGEMSGSSVTITNVGSYGTEFGIPIVRERESAIVAFGRIRDLVVAVDGAPAVRPMLPLTVAADHRLNDGRELAAFTAAIAAALAS